MVYEGRKSIKLVSVKTYDVERFYTCLENPIFWASKLLPLVFPVKNEKAGFYRNFIRGLHQVIQNFCDDTLRIR